MPQEVHTELSSHASIQIAMTPSFLNEWSLAAGSFRVDPTTYSSGQTPFGTLAGHIRLAISRRRRANSVSITLRVIPKQFSCVPLIRTLGSYHYPDGSEIGERCLKPLRIQRLANKHLQPSAAGATMSRRG